MANPSIELQYQQNFVSIANLLKYVILPTVRNLFAEVWKNEFKTEWVNSKENGQIFSNFFGAHLSKFSRKINKDLFESGNINKWNLSMIVDALICIDEQRDPPENVGKNKYIEVSRQLQNLLSQYEQTEIDNESFNKLWELSTELLLSLGVTQEYIDISRFVLTQECNHSKNLAQKFIQVGDFHVQRNNFLLGIESYSKAIQQPGIPVSSFSIFYASRSSAYLQYGDYYSAKSDAKAAILFNGKFWKGYSQLAEVYYSNSKFEKAYENMCKARRLNSGCSVENKALSLYSSLIYKKEKHESNDLTDCKVSIDVSNLNDNIIKSIADNICLLDMCNAGRKYLHGLHKNYEKSIHWFSKAAIQGSAEGYYHLAHLTLSGKGVNKDVDKGFRLMELAASQDLLLRIDNLLFPNIGIPNAEHFLGHSYFNGLEVPKNCQLAFEYYTRAVKHGSGEAANNIGMMFLNGEGVQLNIPLALFYLTLSSSLKFVPGIENLVKLYFDLRDKVNARYWFQFGVRAGSYKLLKLKNRFKDFIGPILENPIDFDKFELEIKEELEQGPLKHLIYDGPALRLKTILHSSDGLEYQQHININVIKEHRYNLHKRIRLKQVQQPNVNPHPQPNVNPYPPPEYPAIIDFDAMDNEKDHVYEGFWIQLVLVEDAMCVNGLVYQLAEDVNGDVRRIIIKKMPLLEEPQNYFGFGRKMVIKDPYQVYSSDGMPVIRVDDLFTMLDEDNGKRCRFCGTDSLVYVTCGICNRVFYCSELCRKRDFTELNHTDICFKRL